MAAQQRTAFPIPLTNFEAQRCAGRYILKRPANISRHSPTTNLNHPPRYALHQPSIRVPHQRPLKPTPSGKALPRKPQGWTRVCHETSLFLRSIGLGIFVSTLSGLFSRGFSEPAKVAVRRNRMTALLRSLVHAVPLGVALMEIILNWKGYYIGATFTKQAYYQFAAKAHEITIQASLTVMVLSYIRYALTVGRGLPFGSLIGGFQFLQLSYLWSTELWASITSKHFSLTRKLGLLLVAVVCSILAATVGPSSATLLIPRQVYWPLQPTRFAINGTFQNVWPDRLDGLNIPDECTVLRISESNSLCPAGDWPAFNALMGKSSQPRDWTFRNGPAPGPLTFHDPRMGFNNIITTELCASSDRNQICGSTPQSVIVEGAYLNNLNWTKSLAFNKTSNDDVFKINKGYYQPYAITSCASSTITESTREEMLRFPDVPETEAELSRGRVLVSVPGLTKGDLLQTPGNLTQFRLKWVDFPPRLFNDRLFGVVILHPEGSAANGTLNITTCTLGAGWGTSAIHVSTAAGGMFYSTMANTPKSWPVHDRRYINQDTGTLSLPDYANISGYVYPQRRIDISSHWARFLDPAIVGLGDYNTTALNSFMAIIDGPSGESASAYILNVMLTTGLARTGVEYGWQGTLHQVVETHSWCADTI